MLNFHSNQNKYFSFLKLFHIKNSKKKKNHLTPIQMATTKKTNKQKITSIGKDVEKLKPVHTVGGNVKWYSH